MMSSCEKAVAVGIWAWQVQQRIDEINILQATYEAMREAISKLKVTPQLLLERCSDDSGR